MRARLRSLPRELLARATWHAHPVRPGGLARLLEESQWWSPAELEALQVEALRDVLRAAREVPFHRERLRRAGLEPDALERVEDLRALPPLEREDLQRGGLAGVTVAGRRGLPMETSGSTGRPVKVLWPVEMMRWFEAVDRRCDAWHGVRLAERRVQVATSPAAKRLRRRVNYRLSNVTMVHCTRLTDADWLRRVADSLERRPPGRIWGVSNALYVFALALSGEGRGFSAKVCWSEGNHLHPHYRPVIEAAAGCRVRQRYGSSEVGIAAHECPEGRLHVAAEGAIVEVVREDGSPAAPGELGQVLVTVLRNRATPVLRYRIGDLAEAPAGERCPCGRGLPVLGRLVGRANELLLAADGRLVVPEVVSWAIESASESVVEFQVVQEADLTVHVRVVQRDDPPPEPHRERIAARLDELLGLDGGTAVERVEAIPLTGAGKLRHVISHATESGRTGVEA